MKIKFWRFVLLCVAMAAMVALGAMPMDLTVRAALGLVAYIAGYFSGMLVGIERNQAQ